MKRYAIATFWSAVFAAALCAVSCSKEPSDEPAGPQEDVRVVFTVNRDAAVSRADARRSGGTISSGQKVDKLICGVYDTSGKLLRQFGEAYGDEHGQQYTNEHGQIVFSDIAEWPVDVDLTLVRNQTYNIVFWAQSGACTAYDTSDLTGVTVSYAGANNDELRDAFCKTEIFSTVSAGGVSGGQMTPDGRVSRNVVLRRPFAQINVGSTFEAFEAAKEAGYEIVKSQIKIMDAATRLNVLQNTVDVFDADGNYLETPSETVTFTFATIPAYINGQGAAEEVLYADLLYDKLEVSEFKYLSMCYVLAADKNVGTSSYADDVALDISFEYADGSTFTINHDDMYNGSGVGLDKVPIQRNWGTNAIFSDYEMLYPSGAITPGGAGNSSSVRAGGMHVAMASAGLSQE